MTNINNENSNNENQNNTTAKNDNNENLEIRFLACIIVYNQKLDDVISKIKHIYFYNTHNRIIYNRLAIMYNNNQDINLSNLILELKKNNEFYSAGGSNHFETIETNGDYKDNIKVLAENLRNQYVLNSCMRICTDVFAKARINIHNADSIKDFMANSIHELDNNSLNDKTIDIADLLIPTINELEAGAPQKVPTYFYDLDILTNGGFNKKNLIVLGGISGHGKTTFALDMAYNIAIHGMPIAFISLEMSKNELMYKLISKLSGVDSALINPDNYKKLTPEQHNKTNKASGVIHTLRDKFFITEFENSEPTLLEIRACLNSLKRKNNIQFVVVDYLGLIQSPFKNNSRPDLEIGKIAFGLKAVAKDLDLSLMALVQFNKQGSEEVGYKDIKNDTDPKDKKIKEPHPNNIRDSGMIFHTADYVILLHSLVNSDGGIPYPTAEQVEDSDVTSDSDLPKDIVRFRIWKARLGKRGYWDMYFNKPFSRFESCNKETIRKALNQDMPLPKKKIEIK